MSGERIHLDLAGFPSKASKHQQYFLGKLVDSQTGEEVGLLTRNANTKPEYVEVLGMRHAETGAWPTWAREKGWTPVDSGDTFAVYAVPRAAFGVFGVDGEKALLKVLHAG